MRLKTILNHCCNFKGFVIGKSEFSEDGQSIEVLITAKREPKISTIFKIADSLEIPIDVFVKRIKEKTDQTPQ